MLSYGVAAVDTQSLVGPVGARRRISVGDAVAPSAPTGLAGKLVGATVTLTWHAPTDNVGVTSYRVYRNGVLLKTDHGHLRAGHDAARAARATPTRCAPPTPRRTCPRRRRCVPVVVTDGTPPSGITALKVVVRAKPWGATLTWNAATDDVAVTGYRIYRDARLIKTVPGLTYIDPAMPHIDMAVYGVAAVDAAGNEGTRSAHLGRSRPTST